MDAEQKRALELQRRAVDEMRPLGELLMPGGPTLYT